MTIEANYFLVDFQGSGRIANLLGDTSGSGALLKKQWNHYRDW